MAASHRYKESWTPERRAANGERARRQWADPEFLKRVGEKISQRQLADGHKPSAEAVAKGVARRKELGVSDEERAKHSADAKKQDLTPMHAPDAVAKMTKTRQGQVEFNRAQGIRASHWHVVEWLDRKGRLWKFKSSWELKFAQGVDELELDWAYEPDRLLLSSGHVYIPDFWVANWKTYVEVKADRGRRWWGDITKPTQAAEDGHPIVLLRSLEAIASTIAAGQPPPGIPKRGVGSTLPEKQVMEEA